MNETIQNILQRRSVRSYQPRPVELEKLELILECGRYAPSAVNKQPWHFIVADDAAGKARIAKGATGHYAYNAPKILDASHVVVLCARNDLTPDYAVSFNLWDNGVSTRMRLDYGDFALKGDLSHFEALTAEPCPATDTPTSR